MQVAIAFFLIFLLFFCKAPVKADVRIILKFKNCIFRARGFHESPLLPASMTYCTTILRLLIFSERFFVTMSFMRRSFRTLIIGRIPFLGQRPRLVCVALSGQFACLLLFGGICNDVAWARIRTFDGFPCLPLCQRHSAYQPRATP